MKWDDFIIKEEEKLKQAEEYDQILNVVVEEDA